MQALSLPSRTARQNASSSQTQRVRCIFQKRSITTMFGQISKIWTKTICSKSGLWSSYIDERFCDEFLRLCFLLLRNIDIVLWVFGKQLLHFSATTNMWNVTKVSQVSGVIKNLIHFYIHNSELLKLTEKKNSCFRMYGLLEYFVQANVHCGMWYHETESISSKQRFYRATHQENPSRNSISRCARDFGKHGTVGIHSRSGRASRASNGKRKMSNYFIRHRRTSSRTAKIRLALPMSFIHKFSVTESAYFRPKFKLFRCLMDVIMRLVLRFLICE